MRAVLDEVFGAQELRCVGSRSSRRAARTTRGYLPTVTDHLLWFARDESKLRPQRPSTPAAGSVDELPTLSRGMSENKSGGTRKLAGKELDRAYDLHRRLPTGSLICSNPYWEFDRTELRGDLQGRTTVPHRGWAWRYDGAGHGELRTAVIGWRWKGNVLLFPSV